MGTRKTIGVVTGSRSDYGIYLPLLEGLVADPDLELYLIVTGMHLSHEFGFTVENIEFPVNERIEMLLSSDTPEGITKSIGLGVASFAQSYSHFCPDILVVLGDRFEMYSAALAALSFKIPVAHIHGGEITQGAIDDSLRHSMTKLSHLHFVSTEKYATRVRQLGEEPWRVTVSGALSLDMINSVPLLTMQQFRAQYNIKVNQPFLLVTYHPVTLEHEFSEWQINELLAALKNCGLWILFTMPNADTGGRIIIQKIKEFASEYPQVQAIDNLGTHGYVNAMNLAAAMVGNSSSGIVEAASFKLPVVNIGNRQGGRLRSENIIDVGYEKNQIQTGIREAVSNDLSQITNLYGDGNAARRIINTLKKTDLNNLIVKRFIDISCMT